MPLLDNLLYINRFSCCFEMSHDIGLLHRRYIGCKLLKDFSDFVTKSKVIAIEKVERGCCVKGGSFVAVNEWMVRCQQSEKVIGLFVNCPRTLSEVSLLDELKSECDVLSEPC